MDVQRLMLGVVAVEPKYSSPLPIAPDASKYVRKILPSPDLELVDAKTGKANCRLTGCKFPPSTILFAPDGKTVAAWSTLGELCLWSIPSGKLIRRAVDADSGHGTFWISLAYSPDGRSLAVANLMPHPRSRSKPEPGILSLWDARSGKERLETRTSDTTNLKQLLFVHGRRTLRSLSSGVADFDARNGRIQGEGLPTSFETLSDDGHLAYAWSPGWISVWNVDARKRTVHVADKDSQRFAKAYFAPKNRTMAIVRNRQVTSGDTGATMGKVELWRLPEGKLLWAGEEIFGGVTLVYSPDGKEILLSNGELRDVASGKVEHRFKPSESPVLGSNGLHFLLHD